MSEKGESSTSAPPAPASRSTHSNHLFNIKYDRVPKLKGTETYRAWRDTAELLLDALDLWNILTERSNHRRETTKTTNRTMLTGNATASCSCSRPPMLPSYPS